MKRENGKQGREQNDHTLIEQTANEVPHTGRRQVLPLPHDLEAAFRRRAAGADGLCVMLGVAWLLGVS